MKPESKIYIAGHRGLVGSALVHRFQQAGHHNLILKTHAELDLCRQADVEEFFRSENIEYVVMAAAKVGGILANRDHQADFLYDNLIMSANVIHSAAKYGVQKLLYLGSSCIYPKLAPQPIREDSLLTGTLEPTNEGYALAKIAGLKLCEKYQTQYQKRFISAMPTNLYGPGDNFHPLNSHVIPGMLRRFHEAKINNWDVVNVWGSGSPLREFLHVSDLADALYLMMQKYESSQTLNVGSGEEVSIKQLAETIRSVTGFSGAIGWDPSKPDGTPRKALDINGIKSLGWSPKIKLDDGLKQTYAWALSHCAF